MECRDLILELCREAGDTGPKDEIVKEWEANHACCGIEDFMNLPAYHIYLRLMNDGVVSHPFSAVTLP